MPTLAETRTEGPDRTVNKGAERAILVVDDEKSICTLLQRVMKKEGYACDTATSATEARQELNGRKFDLVLCDVYMPGESGLSLSRHIVKQHRDTAVILITGLGDAEVAGGALEMGADGYISKPLDPNDVRFNVSNALRRRDLERQCQVHREELEDQVQARTAELREREERLRTALEKLGKTTEGIVQAMAATVEKRDPYTAGHQRRVANIAKTVAEKMGLSDDQIDCIRIAALIHDLGKISVPAEILAKPGKITEAEFSFIKTHSEVGHDILQNIEFPWPVAEIVLQHHERIDGSGYPRGLSEAEILLEAKIIAVADVVEAMSSDRPYRPAPGIEVALREISEKRGSLYDAAVVDAALEVLRAKDFTLE
ncbi:MAG: HD domain-containing phosphohydrolase [Syntrophobacteria bacterium]